MATEPETSPKPSPSWSSSAIENELPTYRAISTWAVAALILGLASAATFASLTFLAASVGAIASGALALRMIRRFPDQLTGTGLANLGIALGLITGLSAPTITVVRHSIIARQARTYADQVVQTLQADGLADAYWLAQPGPRREQTTPERLLAETEAQGQGMPGDPNLSGLRSMAQRLSTSGEQHVHVDGVEAKGFDGTTPFAYVRLELDGPATEQFPARQFALLRVEATEAAGRRDWFIQELTFPYESGSHSNVVESAHGHDH